ncbi:MAG: glycosyltransferase family 39 protein, partial [Planctomycetes bacterium]|nr:glycosyltransferase family 39 protein [Planctomycetota bacterium]
MLRRVPGQGGSIENGDPKDLRAVFREGGIPLWGILAASALLKGVYAADYLARSPLASGLISDALLYHEWAAAIAGGDWAGPAEPYHHPPLYPYVLSAVYRVAGNSPAAMVVFQLLLGLGTLFLCYALARRLAARGAALCATALAALYLPVAYYETRLLPAALATFLAACALRALPLRPGPAGPLALFVPGLLFGLLAAARPNQLLAVLIVLPAAALFAWRAGRRTLGALSLLLAAALGGAALPVAPFFLHNLLHGGEPILLCDTAGVNLYFAHNPAAGVSFRTPEPELGDVAQQAAAARAIAEAAERRRLTCGEVSSHFSRRALRYALEHPAAEAKMLLLRAAAFFSNFEYGIEYTPAAEARATPAQGLFFLPAGVLLALAVAGAVLALQGGAGPRALPLILFVLAQLATAVLFFQYSRFRVVAVPALAALAALALGRALLLARTARGRGLAAPACVLAGVLLLAFLPPPGNAHEQLANSLVTLAQGYAARGDVDRAEEELARAEELAPEIPRIPLARYELLRARGRQAEAL